MIERIMRALRGARKRPFKSRDYWEKRYGAGGNSGAGSYGELASYKASFLNRLVAEKGVRSVIEFGCGDGNQLSLANYTNYVGTDVSHTAIRLCRDRFAGDGTKKFVALEDLAPDLTSDLTLSLDVIYHLVEDEVFHAYMTRLFDAAEKHVVIYASNREEAWIDQHVRHRKFSNWIVENKPNWALALHEPNPFPYDPRIPAATTFADFHVYSRGGRR